jgi:hypothetical protein
MRSTTRPIHPRRSATGAALALALTGLLTIAGASGTLAADTAYQLSAGSETIDGATYAAATTDVSAVLVTDGGDLVLTGATITKTGDTSSADQSSFAGLNAAVLATTGSSITLTDSTIQADAAGANGAFATGAGSVVTLTGVTIDANGDGAHAVMATQGGTLLLEDVVMTTSDVHSGAVATDRGSGTITMTGGSATTSGQDSPAIYSTGAISATGATLTATGAEAAAIEGANSITLVDCDLSSTIADKWGVMIYQSMSGDATGTKGTFTMTGGTLSYAGTSGPLFFVTNSTGIITLTGVTVTNASGVLLDASASRWGTDGANGGTAILTASGETLTGDVRADELSTVSMTLQDASALTGTVTGASLTLDATSTWSVTGDSTLTSLTDPDGLSGTTVTNILGNGFTVTYDPSLPANAALAGATWALTGGGVLTPA